MAPIRSKTNRLAQGKFARILHGDAERQPHAARVGQLEQYARSIDHFAGNNLPLYNIFALPGFNDPRTIDAIRATIFSHRMKSWPYQ